MTKERNQPHFLVVELSGAFREPRKYAQSTSGQTDSHRTLPEDSRSILIARASAQDRSPYATFRKCPKVVPHRSANSVRASTDMPFQKSISSMPDYHHAVIENATPNGQFTEWCLKAQNGGMENTAAQTRRANLSRLIKRDFASNASAIARVYDPDNPKPNYFSDLLRPGSGKAFGEKAARKIEDRTGLKLGQLDIPDSPLQYDDSKRNRLKDELRLAMDDLDRDEQREALAIIRRIQSRRKRRA